MQYAIEHGKGGAIAGVSRRDVAGVSGEPRAFHRDAASRRSSGLGPSSARTEAFETPLDRYGARLLEVSSSDEGPRAVAHIRHAVAGTRNALDANDAVVTVEVTNP